jgi:hypothetical protein
MGASQDFLQEAIRASRSMHGGYCRGTAVVRCEHANCRAVRIEIELSERSLAVAQAELEGSIGNQDR